MSDNNDAAEKATGARSIEATDIDEREYLDHTRLHMEVPVRVEVPQEVYRDALAQLEAGAELAEREGREFDPDVRKLLNGRLELDIQYVLPGDE